MQGRIIIPEDVASLHAGSTVLFSSIGQGSESVAKPCLGTSTNSSFTLK